MLFTTTTLLITVRTNESYKTNDDRIDGRQTDDNENILTFRDLLPTNAEESPTNSDVANATRMENESAVKRTTARDNSPDGDGNSNVNYSESDGEKMDKLSDSDLSTRKTTQTFLVGSKTSGNTSRYDTLTENRNGNLTDSQNGTKHRGKILGIDHKLNFEEIHVYEEYDDDDENEIVIEIVDDRADAKSSETHIYLEQKTLDNAVEFGIKTMEDLINVREPMWYQMGLFLDSDDPASKVAAFGAPNNVATTLSQFGFLTLEASRKLAESFPENVNRQASGFPGSFRPRLLQDNCPLKGVPRCHPASRRYRTADGTCNNPKEPWKGSAMLPMQRFLPPTYDDGIESVRRSIFGSRLPSARDISVRIHRDRNHEMPSVTLMFMQWGQFIDHDVTSVVKSRSFGGSIPQCCDKGGLGMLQPELRHPSCLPIEVSEDDWFLSRFGIRCMEFIRSAPSTRINCDLGWREQINQVTPYIDASTIYGSDMETSNSVRTFKNGKIFYGRPRNQGPLQPPDPPGGELCRSGAITDDCFKPGDGRLSEQPGLTAFHTVWVRFHNKLATALTQLNPHWSDEKVFQETRKVVYSFIQHITYREFLPIVLGPEVMELFELNLVRKGYYNKYDARVNPSIANSFGAAAFRFGHSMVQNSYVRTDHKHRPLFNNVTLHEEQENIENIWSFGSLDRLLLGFANQPSQRRDEFICDELSNHLFQAPGAPFGMDLAAINIQRGRDHGIPSYTSWRQPCGLSPVKSWADLERIFNFGSAHRFQSIYRHVDDIDLFSGGLAEKPVRGGVVGPTFACIIAQQFLNLRKGDRFWYENGGFQSSFTPAQLQQIKHATFAQVICQTTDEVQTIQPFVFLSPDDVRNARLSCDSPIINNFDLSPWIEREFDDVNNNIDFKKRDNPDDNTLTLSRKIREARRKTVTTTLRPSATTKSKLKKKRTTVQPSLKVQIRNVTVSSVKLENKYGIGNLVPDSIPPRPSFTAYTPQTDTNYLLSVVPTKTISGQKYEKPVEVNIKIQYFLPPTTTPIRKKHKRPSNRPNTYGQNDPILITQRPSTQKPQVDYSLFFNPQSYDDSPVRPNDHFERPTTRPKPVSTYDDHVRPIQVYRPSNDDVYNRPSDSYNKPVSSVSIYTHDIDRYSTTERPYLIRPQTNHDSNGYGGYFNNVFEDQPFSTSKRPYVYRPEGDHYVSTDIYSTRKPSYRPQQTSYDDETLLNYNNRPINQNTYNRDDTINEVYSQLLNENDKIDDLPKKPSFGQFSFGDSTHDSAELTDKINKPGTMYTIGQVHKLDTNHVDDKLDFKTRLVTKHRGASANDYSSDDKHFVKISSVKAGVIVGDKTAQVYTVQKRDGEVDLDQAGAREEVKEDTIRVVEIDVAPSEVEDKHWLVYNATEEIMPLLPVPDVNLNVSCSNELPRPMKPKKKKSNDSRGL